ncbi:MAG: ABC transporter permease [Candidatus Dormibacteria bacterium]
MLSSLREAYSRRELLDSLVRRELSTRYRGSALGFLWTFLNPLLLLAVYSVVFGLVLGQRFGAGSAPFAVSLLAGLLAWNFVSGTLLGASTSVVSNAAIVKKVHFPVELLPLSQVGSGLVNLALTMCVMVVIAWATVGVSVTWLLVPVLLAMLVPMVAGLALILAVLNVYFRDVEHILGIALMAWFFMTPIVYDQSQYARLPVSLAWLPWVNPMTSWVVAFRGALLEGRLPHDPLLINGLTYLLALGLLLLVFGYVLFNRLSGTFEEEL